ncbi:MAG TPA: hypothetical protein PLU30_00385 [Verrucomicrobiae bacterium]|nr:hypothetical protein [Verrucomicrobiae bacterium]
MTQHRSTELRDETGVRAPANRTLETLDDIPREIADRRLHAEFGEHISPQKSEAIRDRPDRIEGSAEFQEAAKRAGIGGTGDVLGWSTDIESPAHVLRQDMAKEIATLIHEDLHRMTDPITRAEITSTDSGSRLYEGITEMYTEKAVKGLHGHKPGECYADSMRHAERVEQFVGDAELRRYFFKHELPENIGRAIDQLRRDQT